jgi:predicted N-formylglutamate amidohydrolase
MLLEPDEPHPVGTRRCDSSSPVVFVCEHAGNLLPRRCGDLGVSQRDMARHIAWDVGAFRVAELLAERFDAPLVWQRYSRLVIDCNRHLGAPSLIPETSEATPIPGNARLLQGERLARIAEIWQPFQDAVAALLARRAEGGLPTLLVAMHSFTPVYLGRARPWHVGFLPGAIAWPSLGLHDALKPNGALTVVLDQPYRIDEYDQTIPVHGDARQIPSTLVEIRNDLIADEVGCREWSELLGDALHSLLETASPVAPALQGQLL